MMKERIRDKINQDTASLLNRNKYKQKSFPVLCRSII